MFEFVLFINDDRINDGAVKPLITKEVQERDVVEIGGLEEALLRQALWTEDWNGRFCKASREKFH